MTRPSPQPPHAPAPPPPEAAPHRLHPEWHYHFLGIGGVGMSALAALLHARGVRVSGSDAADGAALERLAQAGIPVAVGHEAAHLEGADAVVYSSALGAGHPIWAEVKRRGLPRLHRAALLGALTAGRRTLAVTGTHGKTTCTAALAHALEAAGWAPTALVGGHVPQWSGANWRDGGDGCLVCEADESDGSFLHLSPQALLLTNVEEDHLDFHGTLDNLRGAFRGLLRRIGPEGVLVYCAEDPAARALAGEHAGRRVAYGFAGGSPGADVRVRVDGLAAAGMRMVLEADGAAHPLSSPLVGRHNALNLAGVFALARAAGAEAAPVLAGLADFRGVARRRQLVGRIGVGGGTLALYDDYAHHPTEIRATLESFLATTDAPLTVVFQPHLYSRTKRFAAEFAEALRPATRVYVTEVYGAREAPVAGVSGRLIVEGLARHPAAAFLPDWRALAARVRAGEVPPGVLLTLGAGDITGLAPHLLRELA